MTNRKAQKHKAKKAEHSTDNAKAEDVALAAKISEAVKDADAAQAAQAEATATTVEKSKAVGLLLLEAKKLHPKVEDFEAFIKLVHGLRRSRAYDLLRLAGGRTTDEELRQDARDRKRKSRASKKPLLPEPKPEPLKLSVTTPHVTEDGGPPRSSVTQSAEISIEQRRAENADLDLSAEEKAAKWSATNLWEFKCACKTYLPRLNEADLKTARAFVTLDQWRSKMEAA